MLVMLRTEPNIPDPDTFHAALVAANEGLSTEESLAFTLRLVLLLANQVGDQAVLAEAIETAKGRREGAR